MNSDKTCTATFNTSGGGSGGSDGSGGSSGGSSDGAAVNTPEGQVQVQITNAAFTQTPQFVNVPPPPAGFTAPYGGIQFTAQLSQGNNVITITVSFPQPIPQGARLYKLINNNYIEVPNVNFAGNTATFQVVDGGQFDADGQVNGAVRDPFVLAVPASTGGGSSGGGSGGGSSGR